MKKKKNLRNWFTSRYLLIIRDAESFAEKKTIQLTHFKIVSFIGIFFFISLGLSFLLLHTILSRWDPRRDYIEEKRRLVNLKNKVDSIVLKNHMQEHYIVNIKNILTGNVEENDKDQLQEKEIKLTKTNTNDIKPDDYNFIDSSFRKEFEKLDYEKLVKNNTTNDALEEIFFFPPAKGIVSRKFNVKEKHYGVDIVSLKNEPIKCIADGTVISASWTQEAGYVISVQHKDQLISFYKHNSVLLKEVGDIIKAGDILAIIGNSGELTDGPHLHFEIWYDREPVDPEELIVF